MNNDTKEIIGCLENRAAALVDAIETGLPVNLKPSERIAIDNAVRDWIHGVGRTPMNYDDHKDAREDAEVMLVHGKGDAIARNIAKCYLNLRRAVAERCCEGCREGVLGRNAPELRP